MLGSLQQYQEAQYIHRIIDPDKGKILLIYNAGRNISVYGHETISCFVANKYEDLVRELWTRHAFDKILVAQRIYYSTGQPKPGDVLLNSYQLETLSEFQTYFDSFTRISRVRGIQADNASRDPAMPSRVPS